MDTKIKYEYLTEIDLFSGLKEEDLMKLAKLFILDEISKNDFLFEEGEPCYWMYFIVSGRVKLLAHSPSGKDVILKIAEEADLLNDNSVLFLDQKDYGYSAQALEDSKLLKINVKEFLQLLNTQHTIAVNLVELLDSYLFNTYETIKEMALEKVERRIALNLLKLARKTGKRVETGIELGIKLSRQDMANLTGTTIETAIRVMSKLKKKGIIAEEKGLITITKRHDLVLLSEDY